MKDQLIHKQLKNPELIFRDQQFGFCALDLDFRFVFVNNWLAELNGVAIAEHIGRTIQEVIPEVGLGIEAQLRQVVETANLAQRLSGVLEALGYSPARRNPARSLRLQPSRREAVTLTVPYRSRL